MPDDKITLAVNGERFGGWLGSKVAAGVDRAARSFTIQATEYDIERGATLRIRPGAVCETYIGNDKVLTGYVDAVSIGYDAGSHTVTITGRSKTADVIDCAADISNGQRRNQKIEQIAADLCRPYGIEVVTKVGTGAAASVIGSTGTGDAIADLQVEQGETAFEVIDKLCRLRGCTAHDDALGRLVIDKVGYGRASGSLVYGENVLSGRAKFDSSKCFARYTCLGQSFGGYGGIVGNQASGEGVTQVKGEATDLRPTLRSRKLVIRAEGQASTQECQDRAAYEAAVRAGKSIEVEYTVQGFRQPDGRLWLPNELVSVRDPLVNIDQPLLIAEVEWSIDAQGSLTTLTLSPPEAFTPQPIVKKAAIGQWGDVRMIQK